MQFDQNAAMQLSTLLHTVIINSAHLHATSINVVYTVHGHKSKRKKIYRNFAVRLGIRNNFHSQYLEMQVLGILNSVTTFYS